MKFGDLKYGDAFSLTNYDRYGYITMSGTVYIKIFPLDIDDTKCNAVDNATLLFFDDDTNVVLCDICPGDIGRIDTTFDALLNGDIFYAYGYPYLLKRCYDIIGFNDSLYSAVDERGKLKSLCPKDKVRIIN